MLCAEPIGLNADGEVLHIMYPGNGIRFSINTQVRGGSRLRSSGLENLHGAILLVHSEKLTENGEKLIWRWFMCGESEFFG